MLTPCRDVWVGAWDCEPIRSMQGRRSSGARRIGGGLFKSALQDIAKDQ